MKIQVGIVFFSHNVYPSVHIIGSFIGKRIEDLKVTKEQLQALITSQEMTPQQKTEIETKMGELQRLIQLQNELINEYKSEIFKEDLKMVGVKMSVSVIHMIYASLL